MHSSGRPATTADAIASAAVVLTVVVFHLAVLVPWALRSFPTDDELLLVPALLTDLDDHPGWVLPRYFVSPDQSFLPRAAWKLYAVVFLTLFDDPHRPMILGGLLLHALCSILVGILARQLGLDSPIAWLAAALHFTAYAGFHAYLWPVGVQHVLTVLGLLALVTCYLGADARCRAGRPFHLWYGGVVLLILVSSLSRASSAIGPVAILVHAIASAGTPAERIAQLDRWRIPVLLGLVYPFALIAYRGDLESIQAIVGRYSLEFLLWWSLSAGRTFAMGLAVVLLALLLLRPTLTWVSSWTTGPSARARRARQVVWTVAGLVALPVAVKVALVVTWGTYLYLSPLGEALNSHNTIRWHFQTARIELLPLAVAAILVAAFVVRHRGNVDAVVPVVMFAGFSLVVSLAQPLPIRYWIYVTPVLAIVLASAIDLFVRWSEKHPHARRWGRVALPLLMVLVMASNTVAIRVELWRHMMADLYPIMDYVRTGEAIRLDLARLGASTPAVVCVNGLFPAADRPEQWRFLKGLDDRWKTYNAAAVVALALGRSRPPVRVGCSQPAPAGARVYEVRGTDIREAQRVVDPFVIDEARLRALVDTGDTAGARAMLKGHPAARPFVIGQLLDGLPDDDLVWVSNGWPLVIWLDRIVRNHANWHEDDPAGAVAAAAAIRADLAAYSRLLPLIQRIEPDRGGPTAEWKPVLVGNEDQRNTPDAAFLAFAIRLVAKDLASWYR